MADKVVCPVCGEANPVDLEFCQNCQSRLLPLTGPLKGEDAPIHPGQLPTKKVTAELEPILPEWLREARKQARESAREEPTMTGGDKLTKPLPGVPDLLAGLANQNKQEDEEEVTPDWLSSITGVPASKKKSEQDSSQVKWVELGDDNEPKKDSAAKESPELPWMAGQGAAPEKDELTEWFKQASSSAHPLEEKPRFQETQFPSSFQTDQSNPTPPPAFSPTGLSEETNYQDQNEAYSEKDQAGPALSSDAEVPDWIKRLDAQVPAPSQQPVPGKDASSPASSSDIEIPDWIKQLDAQAPAPDQPAANAKDIPSSPMEAVNVPDWLKSLDQAPASAPQPGPASGEALPGWLNTSTPAQETPAVSTPEAPAFVPPSQAAPIKPLDTGQLPDWVTALAPVEPQASTPSEPAFASPPLSVPQKPFDTGQLPDWVTGLAPNESQASTPSEAALVPPSQPVPQKPLDTGELPDWIASLKPVEPQASTPEAPAFTQPSQPVPEKPLDTGQLPDWIASLKPVEPQNSGSPFQFESDQSAISSTPPSQAFKTEQPAVEPAPSVSAFHSEEPPAEPVSTSPVSAFTEIPGSTDDVDAIFASMQIPDWLSDVTESQPASEEGLPPAAQAEEPITPADLPSWVQAMRPVESGMRGSTASPQDSTLEERGALAGLLGVLPAIPGAVDPTSKPKSHSIKLDATDQQQAHAALLEQILSAETAPLPMKADSVPKSQRILRWALSAMLIIILSGVVFGKTQIFPLPSQVPNETIAAIQAVEKIPANAPVLVVFDYEPATVGEMEASGASLLDHLLLLNHPRLALISTSPTGAALAERFMATTLADRAYIRGTQYVDLGYLPGGLAGVFDFSQNPTVSMPLGADSNQVWNSQVMQGVTHFSDFASVIVLTDSAEAGRIWIEQTALARGKSSLIVVSSAQAGPMILPYVDSGQVNGLISGLSGAAGVEQANNNLPGFVRRYWDAYSLGLLLAVALMLLGGLWNFWLGIQDRRLKEVG